ncbi:unnamed protein product [Orchesella dallaii]|uniref:Uncharacterized protein n=1 Tax=Orchesella dallaii TaxID=48710 RepID=A0ABP1QLN4_9HEXA
MPMSNELDDFYDETKQYGIAEKNVADMINANSSLSSYKTTYLAITYMYKAMKEKFKNKILKRLLRLQKKRQVIESRIASSNAMNVTVARIRPAAWPPRRPTTQQDLDKEMKTGYYKLQEKWYTIKLELYADLSDCILKMLKLQHECRRRTLTRGSTASIR